MAVQTDRVGYIRGESSLLDTPPREPESRSWLYVGLFAAVISATISVARALQQAVNAHLGREIYLYLTLAATVAIAACAHRVLRGRRLPLSAYRWLYAVLTASRRWRGLPAVPRAP